MPRSRALNLLILSLPLRKLKTIYQTNKMNPYINQ